MPEPKVYARRFVKGSVIVFTALIASAFVGVLLRKFLGLALGVTEYGLFYAVFALISFFTLFRDLGLGTALVKHIPEFEVKKQFSEIKSSMLFVTIFHVIFASSIALVLFLLSDQIAIAVFGTEGASPVIKILSIWFLAAGFYIILHRTFLGFQKAAIYATIEFLSIFIVFLLAIAFIGILGFGTEGVALAYLVGALALAMFGLALFMRGYPHILKEKARITKPLVRKLFIFALPVFIGGLGGIILSYMDTLTITVFRTLDEVGLYNAALPTARILQYAPLALATVLLPMISELWARRERKLLEQTLHFLTKFSFMLTIPAALVFIAFPDTVLRLLFSPEFIAGYVALQILAGTMIIITSYTILSYAIVGIGKPFVIAKIVAAMACFNLVGNLLLVPPYGIEGAAVATFASYLLGFFLMFHFALKFIKFTLPTSSLLKTTVGGVLSLLLIFALKSVIALSLWLELFVVMIPCLLFYAAWILVTRALTIDDLRLLKDVVPIPERLIKMARRFVR